MEFNPRFAYKVMGVFNSIEYGIRMNFVVSNVSSSPNISTDSSGISSIKVPGIKLETGFKYILGIRNTSMSRKFWLLDSSEETPKYLSCLNTNINTDNQNIAGKGLANGKYYFLIDNTNEPSISSITVQIDGEDEVGYLEFDNLLKCVENKEFDVIYIFADQLNVLHSGVIGYTYYYSVNDNNFTDDEEYNRNKTVYTNDYFRNISINTDPSNPVKELDIPID